MNDMKWDGADGSGRLVKADAPPDIGSAASFVDPKAGRKGAVPEGLTPEEAVRIAVKNLARFARDLDHCSDELDLRGSAEVDPDKLAEAVKAAKRVREATLALNVERNKVDTVRKDIAGNVGGGGLDLDAARDEIGRRLACLRRAERG